MRDLYRAVLRPRASHHGFTAIELLVLGGILLILLSIFLPYLSGVRERNRRNLCADHLRALGVALNAYAKDNHGLYPATRQDPLRPAGYVAFSGPDAADPFAPDGGVRPNDVTASLWLLVRGGYVGGAGVSPTALFICPSAAHRPDPLLDAAGQAVSPRQRSNFRSGRNLSYSYCSPFSAALGFRLTDWRKDTHEFAVMADRNPGCRGGSDGAMAATADAPPSELARANSRNHNRAGQNVLYADGHVSFQWTPYCGRGRDNIYTALFERPLEEPNPPPPHATGVCGSQFGAAWDSDSYLAPAEDEHAPESFAPPPLVSATAPASAPADAERVPEAVSAPGDAAAASTEPATQPQP